MHNLSNRIIGLVMSGVLISGSTIFEFPAEGDPDKKNPCPVEADIWVSGRPIQYAGRRAHTGYPH